jgi:hypothetical protein
MSPHDTSFGILTLASPGDYLKAIGLALSLRASNPGIPTAVACAKELHDRLRPFFDYVIEERPGLRGFVHKVYLDEYTPFDTTFFLDSDILCFRPLIPYVDTWGNPVYSACGRYYFGGVSAFGLDRTALMQRMGFEKLVVIDGAGHALFRKAASRELFDLARQITANYKDYGGDIAYADEDVMSIAMTMLQLEPLPYRDFFSRYMSARKGTLEIDASRGLCRYISTITDETYAPCIMHFAANEAPLAYTRELMRLFRANGVPTTGLVQLGMHDFWNSHVKPRLRAVKQRIAR